MKLHEKSKRKQDQLVPGTVSCLPRVRNYRFFSCLWCQSLWSIAAKKPKPGLPWRLRNKEPANEGDMSSISGPARSHGSTEPAPQLLCPCSKAWELQPLSLLVPEPTLCNKRSHRSEACAPQQGVAPRSPHLEKSLSCHRDPAQPRINKYNFKKWIIKKKKKRSLVLTTG